MSSETRAILVVDDEQVVLNVLQETLERAGHEVVCCLDPLKALAIIEQRPFAVIISDQRMPGMSGLDFLVQSKEHCPDAARILLTGALSLAVAVEAINKGEIWRFVAKPWLREELLATVRNALQRHELICRNAELTAHTHSLNNQLKDANASLAAQVKLLEQKGARLDLAKQELVTSYDHSLELCRRILMTYDPVLGGQTKAMAEFCDRMIARGPFTPDEAQALRAGARLCDLGLIGISRDTARSARRAPSQLSEAERALLHHHPIYSQTLAAFVDPRPSVAEVVRGHHERIDGSGYPDGKTGDELSWPTRCLAVIVAFLEYPGPRQAALESVAAQGGTLLDAVAVRLFLQVAGSDDVSRPVREIVLQDLQPGMVLASEIYTPNGLVLLGAGEAIDAATIARIRDHNALVPIGQRLLVYG